MTIQRYLAHAALALSFAVGLANPASAETTTANAAIWSAPEGFIPPPLHPGDTALRTQELAPGVYALLSDQPAVDNSGFVVGTHGVLVIDAHINGVMARRIQAAVRRVTDKPILYLVNTNFHGDHTFGNYAFPAETRIIAHRATADRMRNFEHEKQLLLTAVNGDESVFTDVRLRLPDIVFDDYLKVDLGDRVVELHHFGPGNTPGDTIVYVPDGRAAWTGNLVVGKGTIPPLFEGGGPTYLRTIARFAGSLDVATIIPGHGRPATAAILGRYTRYLAELIDAVRASARSGRSLEATLAALPLAEVYLAPADTPRAGLNPFIQGLHRLNVQRTYLELTGG
jgi:cyclase